MFRIISYKSSQLQKLYQKLISNNKYSDQPIQHQSVFLTNGYNEPTGHYSILSITLQLSQPFELYQPSSATDTNPQGFFILLADSAQPVQYRYGEQEIVRIKQAMFVIAENQYFSCSADTAYYGQWILVYLSNEWSKSSLNLDFNSLSLPLVLPLSPLIRHCFREIALSNKVPRSILTLRQMQLLNQVFFQAQFDLTEHQKQQSSQLNITQVKHYLNEHAHEKSPPWAGLSNLTNMSIRTLKRKFYQLENQSLEKFFNELKMESAIQQLKRNTSIKEIAFNLGYSNQPNFTNAFKKKFGVSPKKYKQNQSAVTKIPL